MRLLLLAIVAFLLMVLSCLSAVAQKPCGDLASVQLKNTIIASARLVAAGEFTPPVGTQEASSYSRV